MVGFVGTTCQVYGLKRFLKKEYPNLFTIDLVCHGTPSPKLWRKYVKYQAEKYGSSIKQISFRNKTYGYHSGTMKILFGNGKAYYGSARVDYMLKSFFSEIASRPSCYICPYKFVNRCSDFTIYDCWHVADLVKGLNDDDRGYTNVIIQSEKGRATFEALKDRIEWYTADTDKAVSLDGSMIKKQPMKHPKRDEFYTDLDDHTLKAHIQKYIPVTRKDMLIEKSKIIFYRTGMMRVIKKVKN